MATENHPEHSAAGDEDTFADWAQALEEQKAADQNPHDA